MTARDTQESHWRWVRTTVHIEGVLSAPDIVMAVIGLLEDSGAQVDEGWRRQRRLTAAFKAADELRALLVTAEDQQAYVDHEKAEMERIGASGWRSAD
jgi:hypothetical protein